MSFNHQSNHQREEAQPLPVPQLLSPPIWITLSVSRLLAWIAWTACLLPAAPALSQGINRILTIWIWEMNVVTGSLQTRAVSPCYHSSVMIPNIFIDCSLCSVHVYCQLLAVVQRWISVLQNHFVRWKELLFYIVERLRSFLQWFNFQFTDCLLNCIMWMTTKMKERKLVCSVCIMMHTR